MRFPHPLRAAVATAAVAVAALGAAGPAAAAKPVVRSATHMYGDRYCEYLVVTGKLPNLTGDVWNTYGLNDCPAAQWKATDIPRLQTELGALAVKANGPRYWLIDRARIVNPGPVKSFDGLRMRWLTKFQVPITNGVPGMPPYGEIVVNRTNTFVWGKGRTVHELLAPNGRRYVMQAYSQIVDPALKRSQLNALGSRLKLPAGWRYRNRTLRRDMPLTTNGDATVLQDELQNTYQRER